MPKKRKKEKTTQHFDHKKESNRNKIRVSEIFKLFMRNPSKEYAVREIHEELQTTKPSEKKEVVNILRLLYKDQKIERTSSGGFKLNTSVDYVIGELDLVNKRFGFVANEEFEQDIKISTKEMKYALNGDLVRVYVYPTRNINAQPEGEVVEVIKRHRDKLVGTLEETGGVYFLIPDNKTTYFDVYVSSKNLNEAKSGDKVVVEITKWPHQGDIKNPEGKIVEILGRSGENNAEMHAILSEFELPYKFPEEVEKEAEKISEKISPSEINKRRDFRHINTLTIDPDDAKDLDDALSIRKLENGIWEVGVHIADVTYYIQEESLLEKEAKERATSVYLVDRVVPMLPEKLSNRLCSLNPNEDKLTFSAVFEIDENAQIRKEWFGRTIINSNKRFSYEQAQEVLEGNASEFQEELITLNNLAKKMRDERFRKGSISFETIEIKFKLDSNGAPFAVYTKERKDAHKLIEEFMLLANKKVAEFVFNQKKAFRNTMVYRVHEPPNPEKLKDFQNFVKKFGYKVNLESQRYVAQQLNALAKDSLGTPEANIIQNLAIRSMSKAKYTTQADGHFGLAFSHYTHFTSPIRRYPDMMVHRLLQHYLDNGKSADADYYEKKCKHSSEREKRAADAERASIKYKQVEYMRDSVGKVMDGIVTGVTEWGIYVDIDGTGCEGMIRMADMKDDFYYLDEKNYRAIGRRTKKIISLGQNLKIKIKATNIKERTIDLIRVQ